MKKTNKFFFFYLKILSTSALFFFLSTGCYQRNGDESKHPLFIKAMNEKASGNFSDAERFLDELLKIRPLSLKTHLELAYLYKDHLDNPLKAAYHYKKCIEINPNSSDREYLEALLRASEKKILDSLLQKNSSQLAETIRKYEREIKLLRTQIKELKIQNERLSKLSLTELSVKDTNIQLQQKNNLSEINIEQDIKQDVSENLTASTPDFYIVEPGDSLSKISRKIYGTPRHFRLIFQANRDVLSSEDATLPIGLKLKIPKIDF